MSHEDDTPSDPIKLPNGRRMRAEHLSIGAIAFAVLTGGTGFGLNLSSNKEVLAKLETLNITMTEFKGASKAADERNAKLESKVDRQQEVIDKLKDEAAVLHESINVLMAKLGVDAKGK